MSDPSSSLLVVGIGNILLGDDAAGVLAVRQFSLQWPGVPAYDIGTAIILNEYLFHHPTRIIVFDALDNGGAPGSVYVTSLSGIADDSSRAPHGVTFASMLRGLRNPLPETTVIGVQPESLEFGAPLSAAVAAAIPLMVTTASRLAGLSPV